MINPTFKIIFQIEGSKEKRIKKFDFKSNLNYQQQDLELKNHLNNLKNEIETLKPMKKGIGNRFKRKNNK